jgi:hypothetical protein
MIATFRVFLTLLAILCLSACDGVTDGVSIGPAVFGVAYDAATNAPLEGVQVELSGRSGLSAQTGSYYISQVPKGTHTLTAKKEGYVTFTTEVDVNESMVEKKVELTRQ